MMNFIRIIAILAIIGIVVISCLFVFDAVSLSETKDMLQKILLALGIVALGGMAASLVAKTK